MKKWIKKFILRFLIVITIVYIILIFNFPNLFTPKDLGVDVNKNLYNSVLQKLNYNISELKLDGEYSDYNHIYGSINNINESFESDEITSFLKHTQKDYFAIKNTQVLINTDNSISISATINVNKVLKSIDGIPIQYRDKEKLPISFVIPDNVNIYLKCSGIIKDNKVENFNITEFEIAGRDVMIYVKQNYGIAILRDEINDQLDYLNKLTGSYVKEGTFSNGQFIFKGDFPSSYTVEKK